MSERGTPISRLPRASRRDILRTTFDGDTEAEIQQQIRLALGRESDLVLWRNTVGVGTMADGSKQRFGLAVGSSDLIGILAPTGRFVALEVKSEKGRMRDEQRLFLDLVRARGGFAAVVRSVEDARAALERAREGASE